MTESELSSLRREFDSYLSRFAVVDNEIHPLLQLKAEHSRRVAGEARMLSSDLGWLASKRNAAEALGLLHDIGRFPQFSEYGTFSDSASVDHGERGRAVIDQPGWLSRAPAIERKAILDGIRYHNRRAIPEDLSGQSLVFVQLIRDADKLDIFRVVLDAVERDGFRDLPNMLPDVTLDRSPSPQVVDGISHRQSASVQNVKNLGDFLLMQLSWVYDLNYTTTFQCIQDRGILSRLLRQLDGNPAIHAFGKQVGQLVRDRLKPLCIQLSRIAEIQHIYSHTGRH